jgi:hypothetical protein
MPKKKDEQDAVPVLTGEPGVTRRSEITPNLPQLYANGFQLVLGPLDVRMYMIETFPSSPNEIVDRRLLSVIMTPETLKLLADALPGYVESYEKQFGKLRNITSKDKAKIIAEPVKSS